MEEKARAGLTHFETQRNHWGLQRSFRSSHCAREETCAYLPVMANAPTALRAYILADAALVRGKLTPRQRAQVARAETQIKRCAGRRSGQAEASASCRWPEAELPLARHPAAAAPKADRRLGFTQAAVLQRGESSSGYSQRLLEGGFTSQQIAEIIASIALNTFSRYFTHAQAMKKLLKVTVAPPPSLNRRQLPARATPGPAPARVHVNDPLAVGIEEFLWPFRSAPLRRALSRTPKRKRR